MLGNQKGSALIETMILWIYIIPFVGALLLSLGWVSINHVTDQILEDHLICRLSEKSNCKSTTLRKLKMIHVRVLQLNDFPLHGSLYSVALKAEFTNHISFTKQRSLKYEKIIP